MEITTNNIPRELLDFDELTLTEQSDVMVKDGFFFRYRDDVYSLDEFERSGAPEGWDAAKADSIGTGMAIRITEDQEVIVAFLRF